MLTETISSLLNDFQKRFPLTKKPFAQIGVLLGISEKEVLQKLEGLFHEKKISRIGPVFQPNIIGSSTLAAMKVPVEKLLEVAKFVSEYPEVNHNYEREHEMNLWFVVTAENRDHLQSVLNEISLKTGYLVHDLRLEEEYRIDLGFDLNANHLSGAQL